MKLERQRKETTSTTQGVVLLADDDPVTLKLVNHHLKHAGFTTRLAADGEEALARLDVDVSVAILDLQMPKLGGTRVSPNGKRAVSRFTSPDHLSSGGNT